MNRAGRYSGAEADPSRRSWAGAWAENCDAWWRGANFPSAFALRASSGWGHALARWASEWPHLDLNQGPTGYEPAALTAEL